MLKVGPTWNTRAEAWDHQGFSKIAQIFISRSDSRVNFIQFVYSEDGGNQLVQSQKIGGGGGGGSNLLDSIRLDYPSEYITGISGRYEDRWGYKYLRSISFETNKRTYGPFVAASSSWWHWPWHTIEFNYKVGGKFCGFFGTHWQDGIESMGIYIKPIAKPSQP